MFRLPCRLSPRRPASLWSTRSHTPQSLASPYLHSRYSDANGYPFRRCLTSSPSSSDTAAQTLPDSSTPAPSTFIYYGPLTATFRRLKLFSLSSLTLSCTLAPFFFIVESSLPMPARIVLAATALTTGGGSTAVVAWAGRPYVTELRRLGNESGMQGLEMTTNTILMHKLITRVWDVTFLVETKRPLAKWELAEVVTLPPSKAVTPGQEETVAETLDAEGKVLGRWIVTWGENGEGRCHQVGRVVRHFSVHEELLNGQ